jgi:hypothetical protein
MAPRTTPPGRNLVASKGWSRRIRETSATGLGANVKNDARTAFVSARPPTRFLPTTSAPADVSRPSGFVLE